MYETKIDKVDIIDMFKNLKKTDLEKIDYNEFKNINGNININDTKINKDEDDFEDDDGYYFINLINIFMKYYNNKFDKIENFFSGIKDNDNDNNDNDNGTTSQMELFFDAIIEYKSVKKSYGLDDDACMRLIYLDSNSINDHEQTIINNNTNLNNIVDLNNDTDKILELFSKEENQIYMLDLGIKRYISPSLLICLNYIYEKKLDGEYWNIYVLRNV